MLSTAIHSFARTFPWTLRFRNTPAVRYVLSALRRMGTPILRVDKLRDGLSKDMRILEVGPSFNPVVAKRDGWKVWVVDHATREDLVEKYRSHKLDVDAIEEVDFIWAGQSLDELLPKEMLGTFDACILSHVIEHIPDFVGFFKAASKLLKPGGMVILAVPDKRFCFDWFRPHSTTGQILEVHHNGAKQHRLAALFDHLAYVCKNDDEIAWGRMRIGEITLTGPLDRAYARFTTPSKAYFDCHGWQFTPASFELIILELRALGLIDFAVEKTFPPEGCEFIIRLRKVPDAKMPDEALEALRLALLKRIVEELGVQADYQRASFGRV